LLFINQIWQRTTLCTVDADEVKADLFERSKITLNDILKYDTIVYGGSLYAAGILGISLIKRTLTN